MLAARVPLVVVTCGVGGVRAAADGEVIALPGVRVEARDPTGAGDTFVAALAVTEGAGWPLSDRLRLANLAAALSVRGLGGATSAPTAAELVAFLDGSPAGLPDPDDPAWVRIADWLGRRPARPGPVASVCCRGRPRRALPMPGQRMVMRM